MALEYEVRAEYQSMSLDQLLDAPVKCFEGVGDTQNDILDRYFSITTVRQLANMPYFLWALGIQEMALKGGESSTTAISQLSTSEPLKFSIADHDNGKTAVELLNSPVNVLDGLTPAQNLALYDSFRITNVIQLAHNRIMLEARVIEYLEKHPELLQSGEGPDRDEVASILGADTQVATSGDEAQGMLAGDSASEGLRQMAGEMNEHVRGRIDALKERAAERARDISSSTDTPSGSELAEDIESRRIATGAAAGREDALKAIRERTESTRVQTVPPGGSSRLDALNAARGAAGATSGAGDSAPSDQAEGATQGSTEAPDSGEAAATAAGDAAGGTVAGDAAGGTVAGDAAGGEAAAAGETAGGEAVGGEAAGETAGGEAAGDVAGGAAQEGSSTAPGMTVRPPGEEAETAAEAEEEQATPEETTEEGPAGFSFKPWMAAAAAALVVLIGLIVWLIPGGKDSSEQTETVTEGTGQEVGTSEGADTGQAAGSGQEAGTGQAAGTGQEAGAEAATATSETTTTPPPDAGPPIRTIHTVVKGESLWRISRRQYQNPLLWPKIYRANDDQIEDPDLIYPDQEFKIPELQ